LIDLFWRDCYQYEIAKRPIDGDVFVFNYCLFNRRSRLATGIAMNPPDASVVLDASTNTAGALPRR
jgi:hypothetical protein